ncbi:MAG: hypothetical protein ACRD15_03485 [Vicinamibacterales bacterium]
MVNVIGRAFVGIEMADVALSAPEHAGKDPEFFRSTILILDGGERVLLTTSDVLPFAAGSSQTRGDSLEGEGEYDVLGHRFTATYRSADGQLVLQLDSGAYITVNDNDGYYLDVYSQGDMTEMIGDDPAWTLHKVLPAMERERK